MNHPVDPKVADRGVLTMPGRQMPYELAMPQGFDRVYSVPGQAGMFYRATEARVAGHGQAARTAVNRAGEGHGAAGQCAATGQSNRAGVSLRVGSGW